MYVLNNINNYILLILINTMGRGAHAAHAAYNGSGTQGISVTNEINENEEIHSVFVTQNDTSKQILHGHDISEMTCAGKTDGITSERYKIFTPDENSDMLGDIYLNFEMDSEINEFTFVDKSSSNTEYDMYSFTEQSRTLDLKLAGSELKSLDVDLNTNQIPSVIDHQNLDVLGFEVINQTKFIEIGSTMYQFIVGKPLPPPATTRFNLAWREYSTDSWTKRNIDKFEEINCLILETQHMGSGPFTGIVVFGGIPTSGNEALLYTYLGDFPWSGSNVFEPMPNFPLNSSGNSYYEVVYTLNYYAPGKIIVSGSKDHTNEYFRRGGTSTSRHYSPDGQAQTSVLITSDISSTVSTYQKVPFSHAVPYLQYSFDPIVSSSFSDITGNNFTSIGDKSESLILGIDSNGKLIRSYDNGKKWTLASFYHGDGIAQNSTPALTDFETDKIPPTEDLLITSRGTGYAVNEVLTVKSVAAVGTGAEIRVLTITGGGSTGPIGTVEAITGHPSYGGTGYTVGAVLTVGADHYGEPDKGWGATVEVLTITGGGSTGPIGTVQLVDAGDGFTLEENVYPVTSFADMGTGAEIKVLTITGNGGIDTVEVQSFGNGFKAGDTLVVNSLQNGTGAVVARKPHVYTSASLTADQSDPGDFYYYIPVLDYVISNNMGGWLAIGKQGVQPNEYPNAYNRAPEDFHRQFAFYSDNDGFEWYPLLFKTFTRPPPPYPVPDIHYKEIVEYLEPHLLDPFGRVEVPFKVSSNTSDSAGNLWSSSVIVPQATDAFFPAPAMSLTHVKRTWPLIPGVYIFAEVPSTATFDYEYIGASNNRKRQIYFGFQTSTSNGVITCREANSSHSGGSTKTTLFNGIYPRSIKYAYRDLFIGVFSNTNGDPDGTTQHVYQFKESVDGITWNDIIISNTVSINSTKDPLIGGDKYGNFIIAVFSDSSNMYNLYRYNNNLSNFEILFNDSFNITNIFCINFVSNEWQIALEIESNEFLLKSHDLTKWFKTEHNIEGGSKVRKISYKHERVNNVIYKITSLSISPYITTDVIAYNILYNPEGGAGVRPYKAEGLAEHQFSATPVKYYNVNGQLNNVPRNKEPNDIIHVNGKIFIACNTNGAIVTSNDFPYPLVESNSEGYTHYQESETIYGNAADGKIPATSFADNLRRLYSSPRNPEIIFTVGDFVDSNTSQTYGVILYRTSATREIYELAPPGGGYYWRVLFGPPPSTGSNQFISYNTSVYSKNPWVVSDFEKITDVALSNTSTQMVVVGEGKTNFNLVIFQNAYNNDFREYTTQKLNFEIIYTVCNLGDLWVVGGKPSQSDDWINGLTGAVFNNKCVAYTFNLVNWKYIDFTDGAVVPDVTMPGQPFFTVSSGGTPINATDSINFEANDIKPIELYGQTGILLQISFNYHTTEFPIGLDANSRVIPDSGTVGEKIYFMYVVAGEKLIIKQNSTYPEPSISFRDIDSSQNRKQLVPSFTTNVNNVERRFVATDYPNKFNLFYVVYKNNEFQLASYTTNNLVSRIGKENDESTQRFRKMLNIDEDSVIKRTNGHCYKITKVKNENFVTGVNSARYVAVGKGNFSSIIWSDDLILWNDADTFGIFEIAFDVTHKHGMWVATGTGNYQVAISKDGKKWTGIYPKYTHNSPEIITEGVPFTSLAEFDTESANITDILPYVPNLKGIFLRNLSILRLFSRIEYHVGTQIWQTLTFDDIKAMLDTEFGAGEYKNLLKNCSIINKNGSTRLTTWIPGFTKTLNSKLETFANITESGSFPSGLLKDQKLSIKIYYNKLENIIGDTLESSDMNNAVFDNFMNNSLIPCDRDPNYYIDSFLADNYGFQLGDTYQNVNGHFRLKYKTEIQKFRLFSKRFELDDNEIDEFNKGIKQIPKMTQSLYFDADNVGDLMLDLDSFNLYASHIIVSGWLTSGVHIVDMNLELNGYTYQKVIEPSVIDYATKSYLGLNYNRYTFNGVDKEDGTGSLVIPLASTAYSGSSVPLDRYNSIRLRINFNTLAGPRSYINVTCVGTTTVSYNNSTANIDLY